MHEDTDVMINHIPGPEDIPVFLSNTSWKQDLRLGPDPGLVGWLRHRMHTTFPFEALYLFNT